MFGQRAPVSALRAMVRSQRHRGPDSEGIFVDPSGRCVLGHNRLSIIDLSTNGSQPMCDTTGLLWISFNGEIYNYLELRQELAPYPFRTETDTEVILAAYRKWGTGCLDHFNGMFAFLLWDSAEQTLFGARDRFGVKPLYYHQNRPARLDASGLELMIASEIRTMLDAGVPADPDKETWSTYLAFGLHDHSEATFWSGIKALPAGHFLTWTQGSLQIHRWYDLVEHVGDEFDRRPDREVEEEYLSLLVHSIGLRFRSDVPVGINLSGGLDSSTLFGLVQRSQCQSGVKAFTYITGDPKYDELPWVRQMLDDSQHPLFISRLTPEEVPDLAASVQDHESEPFGGLPTLAYAKIFESARSEGVTVLMDGQGMDEQWAGYDYYERPAEPEGHRSATGRVQGSRERAVRPESLAREFLAMARPLVRKSPFKDSLCNQQYQDTTQTKIPRAVRFNDRISMRASTELREPFLDHRLFELAFRQPRERKLRDNQRKYMLRHITRGLIPKPVVEAPKRPVQTPQREWLMGPLRDWSLASIDVALTDYGGEWLDRNSVTQNIRDYCEGTLDNSFFIWQWISLGLMINGRCSLPAYNSGRSPEDLDQICTLTR